MTLTYRNSPTSPATPKSLSTLSPTTTSLTTRVVSTPSSCESELSSQVVPHPAEEEESKTNLIRTVAVQLSVQSDRHQQRREEVETVGVESYRTRLKSVFKKTHPQNIFWTDAEIQHCQATLERTESGRLQFQDVSRCSNMVDACVHPTTKEIIPVYGRMAAFAPINIPICAGLLLSTPTIVNLIGWQWMNQTYNAIFNYCNAAKAKLPEQLQQGTTKEHNNETYRLTGEVKSLLKGYAGAVAVSVGLVVGLTQGLKRASLPPRIKSWCTRIVPYTAVACAGMANVGLMRMNELSTGIPVRTSDGLYIGHSPIAAKRALIETLISRALLPIPTLLLPQPIIGIALRWKLFYSSRSIKTAMKVSILSLGVTLGLPMSIAVYPLEAKLRLSDIEPELRERAEEMIRRHNDIPIVSKQKDEILDLIHIDVYQDAYVLFNKGV